MSDSGNRRQKKQAPKSAWKPGQSGNLNGAPKGIGAFRELCRSHSPEAVETMVTEMRAKGDQRIAAAKVLLEYGWGRPSSAPEDREAQKEALTVVIERLARREDDAT